MSTAAIKHRIVPKMLRGRVRQPPTCANCGALITREGWGDWQHEATKAPRYDGQEVAVAGGLAMTEEER
jgi:hypothetical protein